MMMLLLVRVRIRMISIHVVDDTHMYNIFQFIIQFIYSYVWKLLLLPVIQFIIVLGRRFPSPSTSTMAAAAATAVRRVDVLPRYRVAAASHPGRARVAAALKHRSAAAASSSSAVSSVASSQSPSTTTSASEAYLEPNESVTAIVKRHPTPSIRVLGCSGRALVIRRNQALPRVAELARSDLRLAGVRLDPAWYTEAKKGHVDSIEVAHVKGLADAVRNSLNTANGSDAVREALEKRVEPVLGGELLRGLPEGALVSDVASSRDGRRIVFTVRVGDMPMKLYTAEIDGESAGDGTEMQNSCLARPAVIEPSQSESSEEEEEEEEAFMSNVFIDPVFLDNENVVMAVLEEGWKERADAFFNENRPNSAAANGKSKQSSGTTPPPPPMSSIAPIIQSNEEGMLAQARTYQDLLTSQEDEDKFEHYCRSKLVVVNLASGSMRPLLSSGESKLFTRASPSPDGRFILVETLEKPYSRMVPCGRFPVRKEIYDTATGELVEEIAALPLAENIPIVMNSCRAGRRGVGWRGDRPSSLYWCEAQDNGDPRVDVGDKARDIVYSKDVGEGTPPEVLFETDVRFAGISFAGSGDLAIAFDSWYKSRTSRWWLIDPSSSTASDDGTHLGEKKKSAKELLFERNYEDAYGDPGVPLSRRNDMGRSVLLTLPNSPSPQDTQESGADDKSSVNLNRSLLLCGSGASPEGYTPFMDLFNLKTKEKTRIFESQPPHLESIAALLLPDNVDAKLTPAGDLDIANLTLLLSRETADENPQTFVRTYTDFNRRDFRFDAGDAKNCRDFLESRLTDYPHPHPELRDVSRTILRYPRSSASLSSPSSSSLVDVDLTANLYLPPQYDPQRDGPIPVLMWCYPESYKTKEAAGQMRDSPHRFNSVARRSPNLLVAEGIAVLAGPTMPIIAGADGSEPNDTYVEQLVAAASAAVEQLVERGIAAAPSDSPTASPGIAIGGHSYGAFTTANLLAHAGDLFACGIARSGAYNRSLTPFGFQAEERTMWQASSVYSSMSPFHHADKIRKPMLLIHGKDDDNSGTFPMQSERMYAALKGHGVKCRYVCLPHEGHGYQALESVLHVHYEMSRWIKLHAGSSSS